MSDLTDWFANDDFVSSTTDVNIYLLQLFKSWIKKNLDACFKMWEGIFSF